MGEMGRTAHLGNSATSNADSRFMTDETDVYAAISSRIKTGLDDMARMDRALTGIVGQAADIPAN
jgi:hypothetical protein